MMVPKGKTIYFAGKELKAGTEIPVALESKFAESLEGKKKVKAPVNDIFKKEDNNK